MDNKQNPTVKHHFKYSRFCAGLHVTDMSTQDIVYGQPTYVGTPVWELSTLFCVMNLHYNTINKR